MEKLAKNWLVGMVDACDRGCPSYIEETLPIVEKMDPMISLWNSSLTPGTDVALSSIDWTRI